MLLGLCDLMCCFLTFSTVDCQNKVQAAHQIMYGNLEDFQVGWSDGQQECGCD